MSRTPTYIDIQHRPILKLAGAEALDLIQRISTNDVSKLGTGGVVHTILTSEKGKILDVVSLLRTGTAEYLLLGTLTSPRELTGWIERFIIMEDITLGDATEDYCHFQLLWQASAPILPVDAQIQSIELDTRPDSAASITVMADPVAGATAPHMIGERYLGGSAETFLKAHGFESGNVVRLEEWYIHHGLPIPGRELSRDANPHEAGILELVSFTKGCYIGQEVIARLDTYKKVQKRLVPFHLSDAPSKVPAQLMKGSEELGQLTSAVRSQDAQSWIGLGFVKTEFVEAPSPLHYATADGTGVASVRTV